VLASNGLPAEFSLTGEVQGGHAVKIVGWGIDSGSDVEYFICANSWGPSWGEQGFFRIMANDSGIADETYGCKTRFASPLPSPTPILSE
jgi:C1A family cysteine protease